MNRIIRVAVIVLALVAFNAASGAVALAQTGSLGGNPAGETLGGNPGSGGLVNPLNGIDSLPEFLDAILKAVVTLGTIVLTLALIYVGFLFVKAQGNEEELRSARGALMWTVIGGLVLLGAQTIGMVISTTVESLK